MQVRRRDHVQSLSTASATDGPVTRARSGGRRHERGDGHIDDVARVLIRGDPIGP